MDWLYDKIQRVPKISDKQIEDMRHIEPVLRVRNSSMYQKIKGIKNQDARNVSFLWYAEPTGPEFTFDTLNQSEIITQHHSSVFFKPSLAEVYAWIRIYLPKEWCLLRYFCLEEPKRIGGSSDFSARCTVMGGTMLVRGKEFVCPGGQIGYELIPGIIHEGKIVC